MLGFIGSFYAYEGLDLLLRALPAILGQIPDVKVLLVGGGPQEDNLRSSLVSELDLKDRVVFTGRVPHAEVNRYYDLIDVLVYARHSMRLTELVTPLKPLEAMAQGRLMVASDVGGHKELIRDGKTGVLFRAGDTGDLASKVVALLKHEQGWDCDAAGMPGSSSRPNATGRRVWRDIVRCTARSRGACGRCPLAEPRLLVFSSLFPSPERPNAGVFIRERMFRVARHLPLVVVSPQPWFPGQGLIRLLRPDYRPAAPRHEQQQGIDVYRPRFLVDPGHVALAGWPAPWRCAVTRRYDVYNAGTPSS